MQPHHIIMTAERCQPGTVRDQVQLENFLGKLTASIKTSCVLQPITVTKKTGKTCLTVTDEAHIAVHTFPADGKLVTDIFSSRQLNTSTLLECFLQHFKEPVGNVKLAEFTNLAYSPVECEEPNCSRRASKSYHEMMVCQDHYEVWQNKEAEMDELRRSS